MLSFSAVINVEDCGNSLCDAAWVEYSADGGGNWAKLGATGQGYGWYTDTARNIWKTQGDNRWHVASIPLPAVSTIRFRYVLNSDGGTGIEGLAIDDVHIYDRQASIYSGGNTGPVNVSVIPAQWTPFNSGGALFAEARTLQQSTGIEGQLYHHNSLVDPVTNKYFAPRSYTLKFTGSASDSVSARLYIPDTEILSYLKDNSCSGCSKAADAYRLGILKYDDGDKSRENGTMEDNLHGIYSFIPYSRVAWVPYDAGYYAQIAVPTLSELWFYDSGPSIPLPPPATAVAFTARKVSAEQVRAQWTSIIDTLVATYELERSSDSGSGFRSIYSINGALRPAPAVFSYLDTPQVGADNSVYYRLRWQLQDGSVFYSPAVRIDWTAPDVLNSVFPNPVTDGVLHLQWSANTGTALRSVLTDISGKKIRDISAAATDWNNRLDIELGGVARGVYLLHTTIGGNAYTHKIVIQ